MRCAPRTDHRFVPILTWADADDLVIRLRIHGDGDIGDPHRRNLLSIDLTTLHIVILYRLDTFFEGDHESCPVRRSGGTSPRQRPYFSLRLDQLVGNVELLSELADFRPVTGHLGAGGVLGFAATLGVGQPPQSTGVTLFPSLGGQRRIEVFPPSDLSDSTRLTGRLGPVDLLENVQLVSRWERPSRTSHLTVLIGHN